MGPDVLAGIGACEIHLRAVTVVENACLLVDRTGKGEMFTVILAFPIGCSLVDFNARHVILGDPYGNSSEGFPTHIVHLRKFDKKYKISNKIFTLLAPRWNRVY